MEKNTVFMKKPIQDYKIEYENILRTIPQNSFSEPRGDKADKVEMRWRFLHLPFKRNDETRVKKVVEISRLRPNKPREYLTKHLTWVTTTVDPLFDQFVVESYYCYAET